MLPTRKDDSSPSGRWEGCARARMSARTGLNLSRQLFTELQCYIRGREGGERPRRLSRDESERESGSGSGTGSLISAQ